MLPNTMGEVLYLGFQISLLSFDDDDIPKHSSFTEVYLASVVSLIMTRTMELGT